MAKPQPMDEGSVETREYGRLLDEVRQILIRLEEGGWVEPHPEFPDTWVMVRPPPSE